VYMPHMLHQSRFTSERTLTLGADQTTVGMFRFNVIRQRPSPSEN